MLDDVKRIFKSRNIKSLMVIAILISITTSAFATLFSIYAKETLLLSPSLISILFTVRGGANAFIRAPSGTISDRINSRKKPLIIAYALQALAYVAISMTGSYSLLLIGMVSFGLGWGMRAVLSNTFFIENMEVRDRDFALSIYITMFGVGQFLGSSLAGTLLTIISTATILQLSASLILPAILIMVFIVKEDSKQTKTG